ncbi:MAG: acyl-CoA thioesterase [Bacteroidota bacterium]
MFKYFHTVKGYELDSFGHVNNAVYLNYLEQARWDAIKKADLLSYFKKSGLFLVVVEINIQYIKETTIFDELEINTTIEKEAPYMIFNQTIFNAKTEKKVTKARVKALLIDTEKITHDIPDELYKNLTS